VVVFADNRAEFIERKPPENVKVVRIDGLADFIMNSLGKLSPREVESIEKVIQENTRSNSTD
jgi:CRISPR/Cas system CSM-associated protein Csm4 (group 5 of RAMP superfamily)